MRRRFGAGLAASVLGVSAMLGVSGALLFNAGDHTRVTGPSIIVGEVSPEAPDPARAAEGTDPAVLPPMASWSDAHQTEVDRLAAERAAAEAAQTRRSSDSGVRQAPPPKPRVYDADDDSDDDGDDDGDDD